MGTKKFLGVIVTPANVQSEGLEQVFNNLEYAGASAITLDPWLLQVSDQNQGSRMPDLHIDGYKRLLGRPLFGKRELYVESFLAYEPDWSLYEGCTYRPRAKTLPKELDRGLPQKMITEAKQRGMQAHLGIAPFLPPEVKTGDQPVLMDGTMVQPPYIARNVCLNNPNGQKYALAFIEDLMRHYPKADGLVLDWVEFGAYKLEDHFTCFCSHCRAKAIEQGYEWGQIRHDVGALWDWLHTLTPRGLARASRAIHNPSEFLESLTHYPGWVAFLRFKAESVVGFYQQVRDRLDRMGREGAALSARGWCPPWNRSSGMDYRGLGKICQVLAPKLFTFDHAALPRWYGQTLLDWNPDLTESGVLDTVIDWLDLPDDIQRRSFAHYHIPAPEEPHPARLEAYRARLDEVVDQAAGKSPCYPISHPYLPDHQWREMVALIRDSRVDGMWVNFYSYLTDSKLESLRQVWHQPNQTI